MALFVAVGVLGVGGVVVLGGGVGGCGLVDVAGHAGVEV